MVLLFHVMMMMIAANSVARQKEGGDRGRCGLSKEGRPNRNSDARRGRSYMSFSVKGVGCEEKEKTYMVLWNSTSQEG